MTFRRAITLCVKLLWVFAFTWQVSITFYLRWTYNLRIWWIFYYRNLFKIKTLIIPRIIIFVRKWLDKIIHIRELFKSVLIIQTKFSILWGHFLSKQIKTKIWVKHSHTDFSKTVDKERKKTRLGKQAHRGKGGFSNDTFFRKLTE